MFGARCRVAPGLPDAMAGRKRGPRNRPLTDAGQASRRSASRPRPRYHRAASSRAARPRRMLPAPYRARLRRDDRRRAPPRAPQGRRADLPGHARGHRPRPAHDLPRDVHPPGRSHRPALRRGAHGAGGGRRRGERPLRRLGLFRLVVLPRRAPPRRRPALAFRPSTSPPLGKVARRDHRKALIVDGAVAFTGGLNLSDDYAAPEDGGADWRDTHLRIEGPAAAELQYFFLRTWQRTGGAPSTTSCHCTPSAGPTQPSRSSATTSPAGRHRHGIREAYRHAIERARRGIFITNSTSCRRSRIIPVLSARGSRRRRQDHGRRQPPTCPRSCSRRARSTATSSTPAPACSSRRGRVLHAKTAVIDGLWSTMGSHLDSRSLQQNLEVNAIVRTPSSRARWSGCSPTTSPTAAR